jgi:hypothetical protein
MSSWAVLVVFVCSALADYDLLRQEMGSKAASDEVTSALQAMDAKMMQLQLDALNRYTLREEREARPKATGGDEGVQRGQRLWRNTYPSYTCAHILTRVAFFE